MIKYILFDAANTLIHKPDLWKRMGEALKKHGFEINLEDLKLKHKILSEIIKFPDVTSESFYNEFNTRLLNSLGIIETKSLLFDIFQNCKNLPWKAFKDTTYINKFNCQIGVLSNFNSQLNAILKDELPNIEFKHVFISEEEKVAKPNLSFFEIAIKKIGIPPNNILYIGDSLKLDVIPALMIGMKVHLIDRDGVYKSSKYYLESFENIKINL